MGSEGACIASNWAPPGVGRMAVQIECFRRVLATRARRRLHGDAIERQADHRSESRLVGTLMRYFLRRRPGPLTMAALTVGPSEASGEGRSEPSTGLAKRASTRFATTSRPAVHLARIAVRADKEHLATGQFGAKDEANGQHGRAAREVGRRAAGMRCCSAITAA